MLLPSTMQQASMMQFRLKLNNIAQVKGQGQALRKARVIKTMSTSLCNEVAHFATRASHHLKTPLLSFSILMNGI